MIDTIERIEQPETVDMTVANSLPNGAQILRRHNAGMGRYVVLCVWRGAQPYVTWATDNQGRAYWGHYFTRLDCAENDYCKRVERGF
jgi:tellurite resistance-related uncharacterized protein